MKLIILVSLIACSYAAKLDRTYLPPPGAQTSGGSPGALETPFGSTGPNSVGQSSSFGPNNQGSFRGQQQPQSAIQTNFGSNQGVGPAQGGNQFGVTGQGADQSALEGPQGFDQNAGLQNNFIPDQGFDNGSQRPERPQAESDRNAEILRYTNENDGETFAYSFETSNGISAEESGVATNGVQAQGAFAYTGDDGQRYSVTYTADENGYVPRGDHLPTPPPVPEEILRSLEKNAQAAAAGTQEGAYNPEEDFATPEQYNAPNGLQQPSGPSQQYGAPASSFDAPNQGSQMTYNAGPSPAATGFASAGAVPSGFAPSAQSGPAPARYPSTPSTSGFAPSTQTGTAPSRFVPSTSSSGFSPSASSTPTGSAPARFTPSVPAQSSQSAFTPSSISNFASSRPAQATPARFTPASNTQQTSFRQQSAVPVQAQDESGYQYNQPQNLGGFRAQPSSFGASPANNAAPQGSFSRPVGNAPAYRAQPARPASVSNNGFQAQRPSTPVSNIRPSQYNAGGNFQRPSAPVSNNVRPTQYNAAGNIQRPSAPAANNAQPNQYYRPTPVSNNVQPTQYNAANNRFQASRPASNNVQPTQSNAQRPSSNAQPAYNAGANFQSARPSQAAPRMPEYQSAPYQYNAPRPQGQKPQNGNQGSGAYNPLASQTFNQAGQNQGPQNQRVQNQGTQNQGVQTQGGENFSGPLQQPSFSDEEGYKY